MPERGDGRPRLLIVDVGQGPRPSWYLPRLCQAYQVRVAWLPSGKPARDQASVATIRQWCQDAQLRGLAAAGEEVLALARSWPADGITSFGELAVGLVHSAAGRLSLPANPVGSLPPLRDKYQQRLRLREAGVPVPRFAPVHSLAELRAGAQQVGLPAVLKPVAGAGSMATYRVDNGTDLGSLWARACAAYGADPRGDGTTKFILEQFLIGRRWHADPRYGVHVSVESLVAGGTAAHLSVTDKLPLAEPFRETCDIMPSALPAARVAGIQDAAGAAIMALSITSSAVHTELMLTDEGPMVIEVNGRIGGGVAELLHYSRDYDIVAAIAAVATGAAPELAGPALRCAAFLTPQAPARPARLARVPAAAELLALPGVREATVNYRAGDLPDWAEGTRGGTLARLLAVADEPAELLALAGTLDSPDCFRYQPAEPAPSDPRPRGPRPLPS